MSLSTQPSELFPEGQGQCQWLVRGESQSASAEKPWSPGESRSHSTVLATWWAQGFLNIKLLRQRQALSHRQGKRFAPAALGLLTHLGWSRLPLATLALQSPICHLPGMANPALLNDPYYSHKMRLQLRSSLSLLTSCFMSSGSRESLGSQ